MISSVNFDFDETHTPSFNSVLYQNLNRAILIRSLFSINQSIVSLFERYLHSKDMRMSGTQSEPEPLHFRPLRTRKYFSVGGLSVEINHRQYRINRRRHRCNILSAKLKKTHGCISLLDSACVRLCSGICHQDQAQKESFCFEASCDPFHDFQEPIPL